MKFDNFEYDGKKYTVSIGSDGEFSAMLDNELTVTAPTYDALKERIRRAMRKASVRIAIDATLIERRRWDSEDALITDVIVTGLHQRTEKVLIRRVDSNKADVADYNTILMVRLTPAQKKEYLALRRAKKAAEHALKRFETTYTFDKKTIKSHVATAEKAAGIEETPK